MSIPSKLTILSAIKQWHLAETDKMAYQSIFMAPKGCFETYRENCHGERSRTMSPFDYAQDDSVYNEIIDTFQNIFLK